MNTRFFRRASGSVGAIMICIGLTSLSARAPLAPKPRSPEWLHRK
jgi:hypothetical protein